MFRILAVAFSILFVGNLSRAANDIPGIGQKGTAEVPELNKLILRMVATMPTEGGYSTTSAAGRVLQSAVRVDAQGLLIKPELATPSYCSGATYLVLLRTVQELMREKRLMLNAAVWPGLLVKGQRDGEGLWGRWNANGPGTARLFYELRLGRNFTNYLDALPGDFLKIFWTDEIGKRERGHSVIFLGIEREKDQEFVNFWSSNQPLGYGLKRVPRASIAHAIFSRLESPENLATLGALPKRDNYLANLLTVRSTLDEVKEKCGM